MAPRNTRYSVECNNSKQRFARRQASYNQHGRATAPICGRSRLS